MQFLTTLVMITAFVASAIEVSAGPVSFDPTKMICLVNKFRAGKKLPPFHALQARNNQMSHSFAGEPGLMQRCSASGGGWNSASENIASGQTSMEQVMNSWINSPGISGIY
ncbi:hypothetical protein BDF19DRAFT_454675 [Syncephalis fuscata]|nr:hypothetical protein BDF19DRAFT_454675 [Syncephalis fuscata]